MRFYRKAFVVLLFSVMSSLPFMQTAQAENWKEGVHYFEIPFPPAVETGKNVEVREYFWYGCPHCFSLEPTMVKWLKNKPAGVEFVRSPSVVNRSWTVHAMAYYTYEALGVVEKMHQVTFDAIHKQRRHLSSMDDLADFAAEHGIDRKKFLRAANSFGVNLKMKRQAQLDRDANISGVPTIVVDGKYRTGVEPAGGPEKLMQLINHLVAKAKTERKAR